MEVEIESDGRTVWVNNSQGICIGRFSKQGIDVHKDLEGQMNSDDHCLDCKIGPTTLEDWERFKTSMLNYHGVTILDDHMPYFLKAH